MKRVVVIGIVVLLTLFMSVSFVSAQSFWCKYLGIGCQDDSGLEAELGTLGPGTEGLVHSWEFKTGNAYNGLEDSVSGADFSVVSNVPPAFFGGGSSGGDFRSGVSFNGESFVRALDNQIRITDAVSLSFWVKTDSTSKALVINKKDSSSANTGQAGFAVKASSSVVEFWAGGTGGDGWLTCDTDLTNGKEVVVTSDGSRNTISVDGVLCNAGSSGIKGLDSSKDLDLGRRFDGEISNFQIFNRVLTADEIEIDAGIVEPIVEPIPEPEPTPTPGPISSCNDDNCTLFEGSKSKINGKDVAITYIDSDEVVLDVSGERAPETGKLKKGDSFKLDDGSLIIITDISKLEVTGEVGSVSFDYVLGGGPLPSDQVCSELINRVRNPSDYIENGIAYELNHQWDRDGNEYVNGVYEPYKVNGASYGVITSNDDGGYLYVQEEVTVFDNQNVRAIDIVEGRTTDFVCRKESFWSRNNVEQLVYICNWDVLFNRQDLDNNQYESYTLYWADNNVMVKMNVDSGRFLSDEELRQIGQDHLIEFLDGLIDNNYEYIGWEYFQLSWQARNIVEKNLALCGSEIKSDDDECKSSWKCKTEPLICPPHGSQTRTCVDYACNLDNEVVNFDCSPGICSGCYLPKWYDSRDNKCILYGFRFEVEGEERIELVEYTDEERLYSGDDDFYTLEILSETEAELTFYGPQGNEYVYGLVEGETIRVGVPEGPDGELEYYELEIVEIVKSDEVSYVDAIIRSEHYQSVREKIPSYCDIDGRVKIQKQQDEASCQNNYECASNQCAFGKCVDITQAIEEARGFRVFVTKVLCKLTNLFDLGSYEQCVVEAIEEPQPVEEEPIAKYVILEDFGAIRTSGRFESGIDADVVDTLATLFPRFVGGEFTDYAIKDTEYNKNVFAAVAEFRDEITFEEFEDKFIDLLKSGEEDLVLDYEPITDEALEAYGYVGYEDAEILFYSTEDGNEVGIVWTNGNGFILLFFEDRRSVNTEDLDAFIGTYLQRYPSTLVREVPVEPECTDSDGGVNYDEKGEVIIDSELVGLDYCKSNSLTLVEYYCVEDGVGVDNYDCANFCSDGACVETFEFERDGDLSLQVKTKLIDGIGRFNILFGDSNADRFTGVGKSIDQRLASSNTNSLTYIEKNGTGDDYHRLFVASSTSGKESYLLRAKVRNDTGDDRKEVDIENRVTGRMVCEDKIVGDTCDIGDVSLTISDIGFKHDRYTESVTLTAGSNVVFNEVYDVNGNYMKLPVETDLPVEEYIVKIRNNQDQLVEEYKLYWDSDREASILQLVV